MTSIEMIVLGIVMIICPEDYIVTLIGIMGCIMLVFSVLGILEYCSSNRAMIHYVYLTGWLILGIIGLAVLLFQVDSMYTISWLFGAFLILNGLSSISSAVTYAKRAGRKTWWMLVVLALTLVVCGVIILVNPWWNTAPKLFKAVGVMMLYSSLVSILRLYWLWPIKSE